MKFSPFSLHRASALLACGVFLAGCAAPPQSSPVAPQVARAASVGELTIRPPVTLSAPQRARLTQLIATDSSAAALWKAQQTQAQAALGATAQPD